MKLERLTIQNYRAYQGPVDIPIGDLAAFVGRNDIGKTTILDALGAFFGHKTCKVDVGDKCVFANEDEDVVITCVFSELPARLVLDSAAETTLQDEYLVNTEGYLSLSKVFRKGRGQGAYVANCEHPSQSPFNGLLLKKNDELKRIAEERGITVDDRRSNVNLRRSIYQTADNLDIQSQQVALSKEDGKAILDQIQSKLPHFALFRADRPSTDEEAEVQDPMKVAISHALEELDHELEAIKAKVRERALAVADDTLRHLAGLDPELATELSPVFRADPKWESVFKLSLSAEDEIPVNKRGSGVRRLVLISFFKAEAERIQHDSGGNGVIYAIEEPETSQHPDKQRLLIDALTEMSDRVGCQVLLTTHVPGLAEQVPLEALRYVKRNDSGELVVDSQSDTTCEVIARDLGVLPDSRVKAIVCVEGPNDVAFLKGIASAVAKDSRSGLDLEGDPQVILLPLGGDTLRDWVNQHYLKGLGKPEVHIYDRDDQDPPKYQSICDSVNNRDDESVAFITAKREAENYLHSGAVYDGLGVSVAVDDTGDIPKRVAAALSVNERTAKRRLARHAVPKMTKSRLDERDPDREVESWMEAIRARLGS